MNFLSDETNQEKGEPQFLIFRTPLYGYLDPLVWYESRKQQIVFNVYYKKFYPGKN